MKAKWLELWEERSHIGGWTSVGWHVVGGRPRSLLGRLHSGRGQTQCCSSWRETWSGCIGGHPKSIRQLMNKTLFSTRRPFWNNGVGPQKHSNVGTDQNTDGKPGRALATSSQSISVQLLPISIVCRTQLPQPHAKTSIQIHSKRTRVSYFEAGHSVCALQTLFWEFRRNVRWRCKTSTKRILRSRLVHLTDSKRILHLQPHVVRTSFNAFWWSRPCRRLLVFFVGLGFLFTWRLVPANKESHLIFTLLVNAHRRKSCTYAVVEKLRLQNVLQSILFARGYLNCHVYTVEQCCKGQH